MKKHTQKVPNKLAKLVGHNRVAALAVVLFCASIGGFVLPNLFAQTGPTPYVTNFAAHSDNAADYGVILTWSGYTPDHWTIWNSGGGTLQVQGTSKTITGLQCNRSYTFRIAPVDARNIVVGPSAESGAVVKCAGVSVSLGLVSGNVVPIYWSRNSSIITTYSIYAVSSGVTQTVTSGNAAQSGMVNFTGRCGTTYSFYGVAAAAQDAVSATVSATTAVCPTTPSTPPPSSSGTGTAPPSSGSTSRPKTSTKKPGSSSGIAAVPSSPPTAPANFAAIVTSSKIVSLKWNTTGGADHYIISRSTDQVNWSELTEPAGSEQSYTDDSAAFDTTYYYQIVAVGADGQKSSPATTQIATETFKSSSNRLVSQDKSVTVAIPDGAVDGKYDCTLSADQNDSSQQPSGQAMILGPYDLLCVTEDGATVHTFSKPVTVTMKLASVATGYQDFSGYSVASGSWSAIKDAKYASDSQQLSFTLTKAQTTFAAFGKKQGSSLGGVIVAILLALLLGGAVGFVLWWCRRSAGGGSAGLSGGAPSASLPPIAPPAAAPTEPLPLTAEQEFRKAVSQPDCSHLGMAQRVVPSSQGCLECERDHTRWNALRICLICGHVGCSDDSPQQHALKHFHETGHPIIYEYGNPNGNTIGWCYIDQTYI